MPEWPSVVSALVGVAGFTYGVYERYAGKKSVRIQKINDVVRDREDKILFSESVPDVALRPLAASAKEWREKCSDAKSVTSHGSPARRDLQACLDAAKRFESQVNRLIEQLDHTDPYVFVSGDELARLEELKAQLREATREPAARLAARRRWWQL